MSENITYLFGAGASCQVLPVVDDMADSINDLIENLSGKNLVLLGRRFENTHRINISPEDYRKRLIDDLKWLADSAKSHESIDTYAKKLFIRGEKSKLRTLKAALSAFFAIRQIIYGIDKRYDHFFASIINESCNDLPPNMKILSWNYDSQFEKAFCEFSGDEFFSGSNKRLNIKSKTQIKSCTPDKFGVYKINGTAGLLGTGNEQHYLHGKVSDKLDQNTLLIILTNYFYARSVGLNSLSTLSFAWESENKVDNLLNTAISDIAKTTILVIIGYSFPFFNREIDGKIINSLKELKKVYIQSPEAKNIDERFRATRTLEKEIELILLNNVRRFHIPNEL